MGGFVFLFRDIENHWVWKDGRMAHRWMDLIIQAQWENKTVYFDGVRVDLKRGQLITTTRLLMGRWRTNPRIVLKSLEIFENDKMIRCKKTTEMTIITICNYDAYQSILAEKNPPVHSPYSSSENDDGAERKGKRKGKCIKKDNKEEDKNIISQQSVREENLKFFEQLRNAEISIDEMTMRFSCSKQELLKLLDAFVKEVNIKETRHTDFSDFRKHFFDWARIQFEKQEKNEQRRTKGSSGSGPCSRLTTCLRSSDGTTRCSLTRTQSTTCVKWRTISQSLTRSSA